jgi:CheY-like chemotaxis protein
VHEAHRYDVLAVDHKMPGKNGPQVIRHLESTGALSPTIMITGEGDESVAVEAMKLGATDYIIENVPVRPERTGDRRESNCRGWLGPSHCRCPELHPSILRVSMKTRSARMLHAREP